MPTTKESPVKSRLHTRNRNRDLYDLDALTKALPELKKYIIPNKLGTSSVDFSNPKAVKLLNKALLHHYYGIQNWDFPDDHLCPPIPGRADYIHYVADLLAESNLGVIPKGSHVTGLDIGIGASCIYPILGITEFDWHFIGSDIDQKSIASSNQIVQLNPSLAGKIDCRLQISSNNIFKGVLDKKEKVDFVISNPPFHSSKEDAIKGTKRKVKNLSKQAAVKPVLNFSGNVNELVYEGGEYRFISTMINESIQHAKSCFWLTSLVSKESNLKGLSKLLNASGAQIVVVIPMGTGNKTSRIIAWTFLTEEEQINWRETRWNM